MRWIYAYSCIEGDPIPVYERTFENIGLGPIAAERWLEQNPTMRFLTIGMTAGRSYY